MFTLNSFIMRQFKDIELKFFEIKMIENQMTKPFRHDNYTYLLKCVPSNR